MYAIWYVRQKCTRGYTAGTHRKCTIGTNGNVGGFQTVTAHKRCPAQILGKNTHTKDPPAIEGIKNENKVNRVNKVTFDGRHILYNRAPISVKRCQRNPSQTENTNPCKLMNCILIRTKDRRVEYVTQLNVISG